MEQEPKQRPVHKIKLPMNGSILWVAIWRHQKGGCSPSYSVSFSRSWKKDGSKEWISTGYYLRDHLLGLPRAMEVAHSWIVKNDVKESGQQKEAK